MDDGQRQAAPTGATLPVAPAWYAAHPLDERIWLLTEPHVHPIFSANMYLVQGATADLLVDSGMGVAPLRPLVERLRGPTDKPLRLLSTHAHVDHIGAAHEFDERLAHPLDAPAMVAPAPYSLDSTAMPDPLRRLFLETGYPALWPMLIDALPTADYDPSSYAVKPAAPTALVDDGDVIDLGDWRAEVLHLPGHAAGQVGLWDADSGTLFGADAIYDGPLIYQGPGMDVAAYADTLRRLRTLPVRRVLGGHDPVFGPARFLEIIDRHLALWSAEAQDA